MTCLLLEVTLSDVSSRPQSGRSANPRRVGTCSSLLQMMGFNQWPPWVNHCWFRPRVELVTFLCRMVRLVRWQLSELGHGGCLGKGLQSDSIHHIAKVRSQPVFSCGCNSCNDVWTFPMALCRQESLGVGDVRATCSTFRDRLVWPVTGLTDPVLDGFLDFLDSRQSHNWRTFCHTYISIITYINTGTWIWSPTMILFKTFESHNSPSNPMRQVEPEPRRPFRMAGWRLSTTSSAWSHQTGTQCCVSAGSGLQSIRGRGELF